MDRFLDIGSFYRIFRNISASIHSSSHLDEVLDLVVKKTTEGVNAKGALIRILNLDTGELELSASHGLSERYLLKGYISTAKAMTDISRDDKIIIIEDVNTHPRVQYPIAAAEEGIVSMVDLPLTLGNHAVGILRIYFSEYRRFPEALVDFLSAVAEQCALAIGMARIIEKQQSEYQHLAIQTEKMSAIGRMAAGVAHEINNPLAGILLYGTNLIKKVPPDGFVHKGLEVIVNETMRCKKIILDLLEFSRERPPEMILANINDIIGKALSILENEFRLEHIRVEEELLDNIPDAVLDSNQLQQVFINLLINALEAMQSRGTIRIRTKMARKGMAVSAEVSDTGSGIAPEHLATIFEPFFSTKSKGTGLGLAVSYTIIRNHQGTIRATSPQGQGACFTVELPLSQRPLASEAGDN